MIILGGGDTGADCLGTVHRQGAQSVIQIEMLPRPPDHRPTDNPWPTWPNIYRVSSAHEEGGEREYAILTKSLSGENGVLKKLHGVHVEFKRENGTGRLAMNEVPGSEFEEPVDLLLLAMGFLGPERYSFEQLGVELDARGNVKADREQDDERAGRLHRRRYVSRPVAHRVGDRGRPRRRAGHRPLADGRDGAASEHQRLARTVHLCPYMACRTMVYGRWCTEWPKGSKCALTTKRMRISRNSRLSDK